MSVEGFPTVEDIYGVHDDVVERWELQHEGTRAVLPDQRLTSVLDSAAEHDDPYDRAASLLRGIASAHVFEDGNKRTAWVVAKTYLRQQGRDVEPSGEPAANVLKHYKRYDTEELATWLRRGDIDTSRLRGEPDE